MKQFIRNFNKQKIVGLLNISSLSLGIMVSVLVGLWAINERMTKIMEAFTGLTILIMIMGVFAMSLYMIRQKQKEITIRKVNGSTVGEILEMLNKQSLRQVLLAFVIACPIAYYTVNRWLEGFAYKISLTWWVFIAAGFILLALSMLSVSWQSWSAARRNPVDSLKGE